MYKRIDIFDFDGTLVFTPDFYEGKEIWEKSKGVVWPYNGWASKSESLDLDVFHIPLNPFVYKKYLESHSEYGVLTIMATGRIVKLKDDVDKILEHYGLEFDEKFLNNGGDTYSFKSKLFTDLIDKHKPSIFRMYDDRYPHISAFENEWAPKQNCTIEIINVMKSDKTPKIIYN